MLIARSFVQKRHTGYADHILGLSRCFAQEMRLDYGLSASKVRHIVPNPIDLERFAPRPEAAGRREDSRITLLFVSRISVRKGTEMIVELSHRLHDLAGKVNLVIVGNHTLWSDYRGLLAGLNREVAEYRGELSGAEMEGLYHKADALIQPSHYEPFGLTVGEALACGLPVVASDRVGAAEEVNRTCCRVFPAGDMDVLEQQVRILVYELGTSRRKVIAEVARVEAERLFASQVIVKGLLSVLRSLIPAASAPKVAAAPAKPSLPVEGRQAT